MLAKAFLIIVSILLLAQGNLFGQEKNGVWYLNEGIRLSEDPDTYNQAFTHLRNALDRLEEDDPMRKIAFTKLAKIYNYWGRYDDAMRSCNKGFDIDPDYLEARKYFGMANFHKGNYSEAIENLENPIKYYPNDTEAIEYLGLCYMNLKKYRKAMDEFAKISTEKGRANFSEAQQSYLAEQVKPIYEEGLEYFNKGDWERAIGKFRECLLRAPFYEAAKHKLKQSEQNWIADLEEKLIEDPQNTQSRDALKILVGAKEGAIDFYYNGLLVFKKEQWGKAYRNFGRTLEIDSEDAQAKERKIASLNNWIEALEDSLAKEEYLGNRNLMFDLSYALSEAGRDYVASYYDGLKYYHSREWKNAFLNLDQVPPTFEHYTEVKNMRNNALRMWIQTLEDSLSNAPGDPNLMADLETALSKAGKSSEYVVPYYEGLKRYRQGNWKDAVLSFDEVPKLFEGYIEPTLSRYFCKKPISFVLKNNNLQEVFARQ